MLWRLSSEWGRESGPKAHPPLSCAAAVGFEEAGLLAPVDNKNVDVSGILREKEKRRRKRFFFLDRKCREGTFQYGGTFFTFFKRFGGNTTRLDF